MSGILDNPIYFIFTMITNISFYETVPADGSSGIEMQEVKKKSYSNRTTHQMNEEAELEVASTSDDQYRGEAVENELCQDENNDSGHHELEEELDQVDIINENAPVDEVGTISVSHHSENIIGAAATSTDNGTKDLVDAGEEPIEPPDKMKMTFSYHQSNVLYILFLLGFGTSLALDIVFQMHRWKMLL